MARTLAMSWAITPFVVPFDLFEPQNTIESALKILRKQERLRPGSTVVIIGLIMVGEEIVDAVQMRVM
jgi:pyruvate kinase